MGEGEGEGEGGRIEVGRWVVLETGGGGKGEMGQKRSSLILDDRGMRW
jgi:hypothetical protein